MDAHESADGLLDEIRGRLSGGATQDIELVRSFIADHPFLSLIALLVGGDSVKRMVELVAEEDRHVRVIAHALQELPGLGWAISSYVPADAYREIMAARANGATDEDIDSALDEAWNNSPILTTLAARIGGLGAADDDLQSISAERARLVGLAWTHHVNMAYEASIPIVLAQVDGITHDATARTNSPSGRSFFSMSAARQADVVDEETLAGMEHGLPAVRGWYSERFSSSDARGTSNRHGVMHGRELRYDTRINSTKSFVLLLATWEWASRQLAKEAQRRKDERYARHADSDGVDENGWRLDRRGFSATRERLRRLALAETSFFVEHGRHGSLAELRLSDASRTLVPDGEPIEVTLADGSWWATETSESGWVFGIGGVQKSTFFYDGADSPSSEPPNDAWQSTDSGNWSGDCYW